MANVKNVMKNMVQAVFAGLIVGAIMVAANFSGVAATIGGLFTTIIFAIVVMDAF